MTTLSERAMLTSLGISQWTARKLDRRETQEVNQRNGATAGVARVNKDLLPMQAPLDAVHKKTSEIRNLFLKHTMPWAHEGMRILKACEYLGFTQLMRPHMDEWRRLASDFVGAYPDLRRDAEHHLGGLFRADDYPMAFEVADKFSIDLRFSPVPDVRDWRIDVGDDERARLVQSIEEQVKAANKAATDEAWKRIYDVVSRAHERLSGPENIFRDSLIENAVELCALLPGLNITDDPDLEAMRREIEGSLCAYNPTTLRSDPAVREGVADKLSELMDRMGAFYAGPSQ